MDLVKLNLNLKVNNAVKDILICQENCKAAQIRTKSSQNRKSSIYFIQKMSFENADQINVIVLKFIHLGKNYSYSCSSCTNRNNSCADAVI